MVALGASAGGLAALDQFFQHVPADSGMAYVVITHQAPDRATLLPELLGKRAKIPVAAAQHAGKLLPNRAYVAPPGFLLTVQDETIHLTPQPQHEGPQLPIDLAFRSLAQNEGDHAIAIVLSGNGSDGTLGIAAVKAAYGMVIAQDPRSAQYAGMPTSAIATQLVDYVLTPEQMPDQLLRYVRGQRRQLLALFQGDEGGDAALRKILDVLRSRTGHDFGAYKKSTIKRRIERRMHMHALAEPADYGRFLEHASYEVDALFKELLISVTSFFRDPQAFEAFELELGRLVKQRSDGHTLRLWVAGCATGEEAYTIAILAKEAVQRSGKNIKIQIFATDLDQQAVDIARVGRYPEGIAADVSSERLSRFFTREGDTGYRVNKDVRELIVFAIQNVVKDPPFTKLDLLSCRNLLIYLESKLQKRVLSLFSYALQPDGLLLLGTSEGVSGFDDRFTTLDKRWRIFRRSHASAAQPVPEFLANRAAAAAGAGTPALVAGAQRATPTLVALAERVLLGGFVPPSVIVSARGELLYVHGRVGAYFEPASGEPTQNAFDMAREGLRAELPSAVRQAATKTKGVVSRALQVRSNGGFHPVTLTVRRLTEPEALRGNFVVSFESERALEAAAKKRGRRTRKPPERLSVLEEELQRTRDHLQGMVEELETSNEELKSTNEELQSTNEELQSANEELDTSREEMQSLNEELQTVNAELEERNRALSQTNDDMQNLFDSTDVATVFLDAELRIKRFTTQAKKVFSLIDTDLGRPISDLAANLRDDVLTDAQDVLRTLVLREREIQTKEGHWRLMRIMPYRTHENLIDGLVLTFVDIDRLKGLQRAEKQVRAYAEGVVDALSSSILLLDGELRGVFANHAFHDMFGTGAHRIVGQPLEEIAIWDADELSAKLRELTEAGESFELELAKGTPRVSSAPLLVHARRLPDHPDRPVLLMLSFERTAASARAE